MLIDLLSEHQIDTFVTQHRLKRHLMLAVVVCASIVAGVCVGSETVSEFWTGMAIFAAVMSLYKWVVLTITYRKARTCDIEVNCISHTWFLQNRAIFVLWGLFEGTLLVSVGLALWFLIKVVLLSTKDYNAQFLYIMAGIALFFGLCYTVNHYLDFLEYHRYLRTKKLNNG